MQTSVEGISYSSSATWNWSPSILRMNSWLRWVSRLQLNDISHRANVTACLLKHSSFFSSFSTIFIQGAQLRKTAESLREPQVRTNMHGRYAQTQNVWLWYHHRGWMQGKRTEYGQQREGSCRSDGWHDDGRQCLYQLLCSMSGHLGGHHWRWKTSHVKTYIVTKLDEMFSKYFLENVADHRNVVSNN